MRGEGRPRKGRLEHLGGSTLGGTHLLSLLLGLEHGGVLGELANLDIALLSTNLDASLSTSLGRLLVLAIGLDHVGCGPVVASAVQHITHVFLYTRGWGGASEKTRGGCSSRIQALDPNKTPLEQSRTQAHMHRSSQNNT